jgi:hypothetical protein
MMDPTFGRGDGYIFNRGERPLCMYMAEEHWGTIADRTLTAEQQTRLDDFMAERFESATYQRYSEQNVDLNSTLDIDPTEPGDSYALFTHLLWDAAIDKQVARAFETHNAWVFETIDIFDGSNDELVIKTHPAEKARGTNEGVLDVLERECDSLPENVTVLPPETDVNSYDLVDFVDASIVYASTVGLESAYKGTPVITVGDAHYAGKGFTHDAQTRVEYRSLLKETTAQLEGPDQEYELAQNYAYNFFLERPKYVGVMNGRDFDAETGLLAVDSYEELLDGQTLNRIAESVVNGDEYFYNSE